MRSISIPLAVVLVVVAAAGAKARQDGSLDPRIAAYDKGPVKIDVSKYPPEIKATYKLFASKCGSCHTLARAINCEFATEAEWERYVKRMMAKSGTFISPAEGKQIYQFLVYDSKTRKKDLYERKQKEGAK